MLKYTRLPWSIHEQRFETMKQQDLEADLVDKYVQRMETIKQSGSWNSPGKVPPHGYYVISLVVWYLLKWLAKPGIHEIWTFRAKFDREDQHQSTPKQQVS